MNAKQGQRIIMHVDMDAFYASIEQRDNPDLRGKPVIVGSSGERGVVAAASYEVREFGVRSAMPSREAVRRCPDAIFIRPRIDHYRQVSRVIFDVFRQLTPVVEGLSLDEAFLDFSDEVGIAQCAQARALDIKQRILTATGLNASVGVGPNKLVAKIASDINKPDGLCMLFGTQIEETLDTMPARKLPGIGRKTEQRLHSMGISTIGDLRTAPDAALSAVFGRYAMRVKQRAAGIDERPVTPHRADKSISSETTFNVDLVSLKKMKIELTALADQTAARARKKELHGAVVIVKIRTADFRTQTRQMPLQPASNSTATIGQRARELLDDWYLEHPDSAVRLLGVGIAGLVREKQLDLFAAEHDSEKNVDQVLDTIRKKYGTDSVKRGSRLR
ncbi:MAG: DNA polymerase IV [Gammaproteobacteria bacterium]|nr:DNA polymerase IV [Gammaproteobacteria bacterium]